MGKQKLSVCLVVHNEEKLIRRCLDSVAAIADEMIVVHDGPCTDTTLQIAEEYGARCIVSPTFKGLAEYGRVISYEAAQYEWILQIDADEFLSDDLRNAFPRLLENDSINAYEVVWPLFNGSRYITKDWPVKRILFRRKFMSYIGLPHYVVDVPGKVERLPYVLEHKPEYNNYSWRVFKKKWTGWAHIQARMMLKNFSEIPTYNCLYSDWRGNLKFRREFPLLALIFDGPFIFIKIIASGGWRQGIAAYKLAFFFACFRSIIDWDIFTLKTFKR